MTGTNEAVFLVRRHEQRLARRRAEAEQRREKRLAELDRLPNGQIVWPDGRGEKPSAQNFEDAGEGSLW